ncbi:MAG: DUF5050 domain-containing protein [Phycisphaerales bacterium]|nr:MAG: DUF5050 domain-containing protein [Phycisphaerales bacterium]
MRCERKPLYGTIVGLVLGLSALIARADMELFWTDYYGNAIQRANLDGTDVETVCWSLAPSGIALDAVGEKMYWLEPGRVRRADLDGTNAQTFPYSGASSQFIALDVAGGKMYWTESRYDRIWRANLDGSGMEVLVDLPGDSTFRGIALDVAAGKMYFADSTRNRIQRANLDGSEIEDVVTTGISVPRGLALDVAAGKVYWAESVSTLRSIRRANLDGSNVEDVVTGLGTPSGLALDLTGRKVYWSDRLTDSIGRADLDGGNVEQIVTGLDRPDGVAILAVPVPPLLLELDIKPGSCPNSFNRKSRGALHTAVCGTETFDVTAIDIASVRLLRADGVGGQVAPHEGPPGPHSFFDDVATPYHGESCHELGADGIVDLQMHFKNETVTTVLELDALAPGALVELVINGSLLDDTPFTTETDSIRLVPPGGPPGLVAVSSTIPDVWIDAYPLDLQLDDGGFADFERSYPQSTMVTYVAPRMADGVRFAYWQIDGQSQARGQAAVGFEVVGDVMEAAATYRNLVVESVQDGGAEAVNMEPIGGTMQPGRR